MRKSIGLGALSLVWAGPARAQLLGNRSGEPPPETWVPEWAQPVLSWIVEEQLFFHGLLQDAVIAYKVGDSIAPAVVLISIAFIYGIFHAVGPGHGKAVVSAFFLARDSQIKRGIAMGWSIAGIQSIVAITLVGLVGYVLGVGRITLLNSMPLVEATSYGLVVVLGLVMTWRAVAAMRGAGGHDHDHGHCRDHDHDPHHHHGPSCGHDHGTGGLSDDVAGAREFWGAALASGIRPCTGALIVLIFSVGHGIFFVGALAALAMGVGVALTVSAIGIAAILARRGIVFTLGSVASNRGVGVVSVLGSLIVVALGTALLAGALVRV